jgi:ABC-2 type transport system permease protein
MPDVALTTLRGQRRALAVWALALVALVALYVGIYPSMRDNSAYSQIIDEMPRSVRALFMAGLGGDVTSGPGYLYVELLSFMAPLLVLLYAIGTGGAAVAGEEERHTLDLLLACPVTRRRVVLEKLTALVTGVVVLCATLTVATLALGSAAGMGLRTTGVVAAMTHLALLGTVFGMLALLVGAVTGRVAVSRALPACVAVIAYVVNGLAPTVTWLGGVRPVSPFFQYLGHDPVRHGISWPAVGVSVATTVVLLSLAVWSFDRRDVL